MSAGVVVGVEVTLDAARHVVDIAGGGVTPRDSTREVESSSRRRRTPELRSGQALHTLLKRFERVTRESNSSAESKHTAEAEREVEVSQGGINPRGAPSTFEVSQGGVTPPGARREADVAPDFEKKVTVLEDYFPQNRIVVAWSLEKTVERKRMSNGIGLGTEKNVETELALSVTRKEGRTEKKVERKRTSNGTGHVGHSKRRSTGIGLEAKILSNTIVLDPKGS